jgi:hypothetical protein
MTTSLAFCANTGASLIDLPRTEPTADPHADPQASSPPAVHWHFGPDTQSRCRLNRAKTLEFDWAADVKTFEDLLDDAMNEPTVTNVCSGRQPTYVPAAQIPRDGYLRTSARATKASSATEGRPADPFANDPQIPRYL